MESILLMGVMTKVGRATERDGKVGSGIVNELIMESLLRSL